MRNNSTFLPLLCCLTLPTSGCKLPEQSDPAESEGSGEGGGVRPVGGTTSSTSTQSTSSLATASLTGTSTATATKASASGRKVLLVVANDGFYFQEYNDPLVELEAAGIEVVVAAGRKELAVPHANSGQTASDGSIMPELALGEVDPDDYEALVFAGGWGASSYQYAFSGTIDNPAWRADPTVAATVNELITSFLADEKYVVGICHGVSILAWARVDGASPLAGKQVTASDLGAPAQTYNGIHYVDSGLISRQLAADNGAVLYGVSAIGDPSTPADDVAVDGLIVTAQNQHSARAAGVKLVELLDDQLDD
jgi:putative intracellular protease/amidase